MTERILVVDDDPDIRIIAKLALESVGGMHVTCAESADEAVAFLEGDRPTVVLLDVMMPGCDGTGCLSRIRRLKGMEDLPIIFMTARTEQQHVTSYLQAGAVGVIGKPFDPLQLASQVRHLLQDAP